MPAINSKKLGQRPTAVVLKAKRFSLEIGFQLTPLLFVFVFVISL